MARNNPTKEYRNLELYYYRVYKDYTFKLLAVKYNISISRVSEIFYKAFYQHRLKDENEIIKLLQKLKRKRGDNNEKKIN